MRSMLTRKELNKMVQKYMTLTSGIEECVEHICYVGWFGRNEYELHIYPITGERICYAKNANGILKHQIRIPL